MSGYLVSVFVLLHLLLVNTSTAKPDDDMTRIVGGTAVSISRVPYMLQMWRDGVFICGASLLSEMFGISAAHCVVDSTVEQLTLVGGATTLTQRGVRRRLSKVIIPEAYSRETFIDDVAVLKFIRPMKGPNIRPIPVNTQPLRTGMTIFVSGWGLTTEGGKKASNQALSVRERIVPRDKCRDQYKYIQGLTQTMFCAAAPNNRGSCSGDSGGPAAINNKLAGIVSWGFGCARSDYSGVYTDLTTQLRFIEIAMEQ